MDKPTRESLYEGARKQLMAEFERAKAEIPHYAERGAEVEQVLIKWLNEHLPKRFQACSGFIMDDDDKISSQTDIIIYDALNCPLLRYSEKTAIIPADNAAVAIEVKSRLTKEEIIDAKNKISIIKSLGKSSISDMDMMPKGANKVVQRQTLSIVFAYECSANMHTVAGWYAEILKEPGNNGRHIDFICILNKGWLNLGFINPETKEFGSILCPEPILTPLNVPEPLELFVAYYEYPDRTLLTLFRTITSYLVLFRTKMYIAHKDIFDSPIKGYTIKVGMLPNHRYNKKPKITESVTTVKFSSKKHKKKKRKH